MPDYAQSNIQGSEGKSVKAGDPVSASALGLTDEEYEELEESNAVSDEKPEDMGSFTGSPAQWDTMEDEEKEVYFPADGEEAPNSTSSGKTKTATAAKDEGK